MARLTSRPAAQPSPLPGPDCPGPRSPYPLKPHQGWKVALKKKFPGWNLRRQASLFSRWTGCRLHRPTWAQNPRRRGLKPPIPCRPAPEQGSALPYLRGKSMLQVELMQFSSALAGEYGSRPAQFGRKGWPQSPVDVTLTHGMPCWRVRRQRQRKFARGRLTQR